MELGHISKKKRNGKCHWQRKCLLKSSTLNIFKLLIFKRKLIINDQRAVFRTSDLCVIKLHHKPQYRIAQSLERM